MLVVDSLLTYHIDKGKGPVVLMLHGWGDSSSTFAKLADELSKDYRIITLDLPGFGKTEPPKQVWGLEDYARFLQKFLTKLGVKQVTAIVGHSNGGAIAIKAVSQNIVTPKKLVLLASSGIRPKNTPKKLALKMVAKTGKLATSVLPAKTKRHIRSRFYQGIGSDLLVAEHMQETFVKIIEDDLKDDALYVLTPTLLVYGQSDADTPPMHGQIYKRLIPESKFELIVDAGHFVHHDQPAKVAKLVRDFLK
jgi:pimeloyl-ACP methyl ester carboxylesterase